MELTLYVIKNLASLNIKSPPIVINRSILGHDESVGFAVKLVIETKIRFYIHYIYSHTTNLYES